MKNITRILIAICLSIGTCQLSFADEVYPTVIFDFAEKGKSVAGMGEKVSAIIFASLITQPNISLVEREEMQKLEDEAVLTLSGMVNSQQAIQIGQLTGAKIIVTGTLFEIEDTLMMVSKIISTETSRVLGASVKGNVNSSIVTLAEDLAGQIAQVIVDKGQLLVAKPVSRDKRVAALKAKLKTAKKPSITIDIKEHHINRATSDPAAETEMMFYGTEVGFEVIDKSAKGAKNAKLLIIGEGFSEFATRKGALIGVKARLEVKVIEQATKRVIAVDRQTELEVDLSEISAAKKALQRASAKIAERILAKIVQ